MVVERNLNNAVENKQHCLGRFDMSERGRGEFWAFMAGILAGGVAAVLYAPAKGEDTRRKIRDSAEDTYHKGERLYGEGRVKAEKIYHDGRGKADKIYHDGRDKAEKMYSDGRSKVEDSIEYVRDKIHHEDAAAIETDPEA